MSASHNTARLDRGLYSLAALAVCLGTVACHSAQPTLPDPPKEVLKLGQMVGRWRNNSHHLASSLRAATSDMDLTFDCKWTPDKYSVSCVQTGEIGGKKVREVDIFGYSEHARLYTMMVVLDVGGGQPQIYTNWFAWDKDTWRFLPRDGIRTTWEFKSPDYHVTQTEHTADGVNWVVAATGEQIRLP